MRFNKQVIADMDPQVRELALRWKARHNKATFSVKQTPVYYAREDAHVTMVNLATHKAVHARAAGEFAGMTKLSPTAEIPLPVGVVAVEEGFFCGVPFLAIYQGGPKQLA